MSLLQSKSAAHFLSSFAFVLLASAPPAHAASVGAIGLICAETFAYRKPTLSEGLLSVQVEDLKLGRSLGAGEEGQAFLADFNGKKVVVKLFDQTTGLAKLFYQNLTPEQRAELARLDYREALRREHEIYAQGPQQRSATVFDLAALDQGKWLMRLVDSRRMQGLRYQGHKIAPEIYALVRNSEGRIVGLVTEYVPGKSLRKLVEAWSMSDAEIDAAIDQAIEQVKILGANGFYHGDPAANIVVSFGKDRKVIARLIDFMHVMLAPAQGQSRWEIDVELLEQERRVLKGEAPVQSRKDGRFYDVGF